MRVIMSLQWKIKKESKAGKEYDLYCYLLDDGMEVESLQPYDAGQKVVVWFDDQWNKAKIKPSKNT